MKINNNSNSKHDFNIQNNILEWVIYLKFKKNKKD